MKKLIIILLLVPLLIEGQIYDLNIDTITTLGQVIEIGKVYDTYSWDSDFTRYETGLSTPLSSEMRININDFVIAIKDSLSVDSLAEVFDIMYVFSNETSEAALRNLVERDHDATAYNSPTFTQYQGFTGNGSNTYIDLDFVASTDGVNYTTNSASYGLYCLTDNDGGGSIEMGANGTGDILLTLLNSNFTYIRINSNGWTTGANTHSNGMFIVNKINGATEQDAFKNSSQIANGTATNTGLPNVTIFILAQNNAGSPASYSSEKISFVFAGRGLSTTEIRQITNCYASYKSDLDDGLGAMFYEGLLNKYGLLAGVIE